MKTKYTLMISALSFLLLTSVSVKEFNNVKYESFTNITKKEIKKNLEKNDIVFVDEVNNNKKLNPKKLKNEVDNNVDEMLFSTYYYKENGKIKFGELYTTEYASEEDKNNLKQDIISNYSIETLSTIEPTKKYLSTTYLGNGVLEIGEDWTIDVDYRRDLDLLHNKKDLGNYTEYVLSGYFNANTYGYRFFAYRGFLTPTKEDEKIRSEFIQFDFNPTLNPDSNCELYDYSPKLKNPETSVSVGINIGGEISKDGPKASLGLSGSYTTLVSSPLIHDNGAMGENLGSIKFEYINCNYNNTGDEEHRQYNRYCREQTLQEAIFLFRLPVNNTNQIKIKDYRDVCMFSDGLINFHRHNKFDLTRIIDYV